MINNKEDLKRYLDADNRASHQGKLIRKPKLIGDDLWKYQIALRKCEYYMNTNQNVLMKTLYIYRHYKMGVRLGLEIPCNVFKEGLWIVHQGKIDVSPLARVGAWCEIYQNVTLGEDFGKTQPAAPQVGDYVTICAGAVLVGGISIGDNNIIGANSVVTKSFNDDSVTIAGNPAKIIKQSVKIDMRKKKQQY